MIVILKLDSECNFDYSFNNERFLGDDSCPTTARRLYHHHHSPTVIYLVIGKCYLNLHEDCIAR